MVKEDIIQYFEEYGGIECIHIGIRLKDERNTAAVLRNRHHKIGNYIFGIEDASKRSTDPQNHKRAKHNHSTTNMLDLNDECLSKIFQFMNDYDLCRISDTCVRFKKLAELAFSIKHKAGYNIANDEDTMISTENHIVLQHFGDLIECLNVDWCYEIKESAVWKSAVKNCSKLLHLYLHAYNAGGCKFDWYEIIPIFPKLKSFYLSSSGKFTIYANHFHPVASNLQKLSLNGINISFEDSSASMAKCFPNLKQFSYYEKEFNGNAINQLCKINSLTHLSMIHVKIDLVQLTNCLVENEVPIESIIINKHFYAIYIDIDEFVGGLTKLKGIKILKFKNFEKFTDNHLLRISKTLPLLRNFELKDSELISIDGIKEMMRFANGLKEALFVVKNNLTIKKFRQSDYTTLLNLVKKPMNKKKLTISFRANVEMEIDSKTLKSNEEWFHIDQ